MARISTKPVATSADIDNNDYLLGNDLNGSSVVTKTFTIESLREFILDGLSTPENIPEGFVAYSDRGSVLDKSSIRVQTDSQTFSAESPLAINNVNIDITTDGNGQVKLLFENPNLKWIFDSLEGGVFSAYEATSDTEAGSDPSWTGTINSIDDFYYDSDGDTIFGINVTLDDGVDIPVQTHPLGTNFITGNQLELSGTFDFRKTDIAGDLTVSGGVIISGESSFEGEINIGNPISDDAEVHINGRLFFDAANPGMNDGIVFGDGVDPDILMTTDGDDLLIQGSGVVRFSNGNEEDAITISGPTEISNNLEVNTNTSTNHTITVSSNQGASETIISPTSISVDGSLLTPTTVLGSNGVLTSVNGFAPPTPTSSATALPGLNATLAGIAPADAPVTPVFFTGVESQGSARFGSSVTDLTNGTYSFANGDTTFTVDAGDATAFTTHFTNSGDNEDFFFATNSFTPPAIGTAVDETDSGQIYTIAAYDTDTRVATFGALGPSNINIGSDVLTVTSEDVRLLGIDTSTTTGDFLFIDSANNNRLSAGNLEVSSNFNSLSYNDSESDTGDVVSVGFIGAHNINESDSSNPIMDLSGRYAFGGELDSDDILAAFEVYVLNTISSDRILTLPESPTIGDSIKIVNLSTIDAENPGNDIASSQWSIVSPFPITHPIMRQTTALELNDQTASFELYWTGSTWVIIGIN